MKSERIVLLLLAGLAIFVSCPATSEGSIYLWDLERGVDAEASAWRQHSTLLPPSVWWQLDSDSPPGKIKFGAGSWNDSVAASIAGCSSQFFFCGTLFNSAITSTASASQDSIVNVTDNHIDAAGGGDVATNFYANTASSYFAIGFQIYDTQQYSYRFDVAGVYTWTGAFAPNSAGVLGPGYYESLYTFSSAGFDPVPYSFSLTVDPYAGPQVPEPSSLFLVFGGLLAARLTRRLMRR